MNRLRGFGPAGVLAIVVILLAGNLLGAVLTLGWVLASRTAWHELGFVRSRSWDVTRSSRSPEGPRSRW